MCAMMNPLMCQSHDEGNKEHQGRTRSMVIVIKTFSWITWMSSLGAAWGIFPYLSKDGPILKCKEAWVVQHFGTRSVMSCHVHLDILDVCVCVRCMDSNSGVYLYQLIHVHRILYTYHTYIYIYTVLYTYDKCKAHVWTIIATFVSWPWSMGLPPTSLHHTRPLRSGTRFRCCGGCMCESAASWHWRRIQAFVLQLHWCDHGPCQLPKTRSKRNALPHGLVMSIWLFSQS